MIIYGLKSELKWLKYPESCAERINTLPESIAFYPTIGISISLAFRKLYIHTFPRTLRLAQSDSDKIFTYLIKTKTEKSQDC